MPREKKIIGPAVKTTAVIPQELYNAVFPTRKEKIAETINEGLTLVLAKRKKLRASGMETKPETKWHRMLTQIFGSGDAPVIGAIQQNIAVFYDRLRLRPPSASGRKSGDAS